MMNALFRFCAVFILAAIIIRFREKIIHTIRYNRYFRNLAMNLWMKLSS
ncbi:hypothetical protein [Lederbergia ruris]|uniref:Uncharacterized protein n=1 Tax=Lederbergia ruris TaxID=217495 RepID=A0ABQ4KE81_9BACI|nr:hypothetical protein [Lederbergia ruris]GIN55781.1 hypothetical protein J8TS2_01000 [Lederbergia ruris]